MKFEKKLYLGLFLLVAGLVPLALIAISSLYSVNRERTQLTEGQARSVALANDLRFRFAREGALALHFTLSGDPERYAKIVAARADFEDILKALEAVDPAPETHARLSRIRGLKQRQTALTSPALQLRLHGAPLRKAYRMLEDRGMGVTLALGDALNELFAAEVRNFGEARLRINATTARLIHGLLLASILTGALFAAIILLLVRLTRSRLAQSRDRELLLEQTRRAAQARKDALETVSHDLKNPLTSVELSLRMLERRLTGELPPGAADRALGTALRATEVMKELIVSLLDQAKLESGDAGLELAPGQLPELLRDVIEIHLPIARQKSIAIEASIDDRLPPLRFDSRRIRQVAANVLGNAIKFTPPGGRIEVHAGLKGGEAEVCITDSGPGIPAERLGQVFERFWQAQETRKQGTGLGLAIAKALIEAHGGRIWAESAPGRGAAFFFTLPMEKTEARAA